MSIFGLTGQLACGKSTILKLLKRKGVRCFDVDKVIHQYYCDKQSLAHKRIKALFPQANISGKICRKKLSGIVFSDKQNLKRIEKAVHPLIIKDLLKWIKEVKTKKGVYIAEVPLLFEKKLEKYFDGVILVRVKKDIILQRINKKYKFSKQVALDRLSLYLPIKEKIKRADYMVDNNKDFRELKKGVDLLWKKISQK